MMKEGGGKKKNNRFIFYFSLITFLLSCSQTTACDSTLVIAHRGASSIAPENTLSAFSMAIDFGADFFECDVHLSADDSLMIIHDGTVDRTTDGTGSVSSMTYNQLRQLDAGYPDKFGSQFAGEQIPTLNEVLSLAKNTIKVCIELKDNNLENRIMNLVQQFNMKDEVVIFAFNLNQLQTIKNLDPNIAVCNLEAFLTSYSIDDVVNIGGEIVSGGIIFPSQDNINYAHQNNIEIWQWKVEDTEDMIELMTMGIDGIITDYPQDLIELQDSKPGTGLVCYINLNEGAGVTLNDITGNGNNGLLYDGTWTSGHSGSALIFDGIDDYADVPNTPMLDINNNSVSISAWVKLDELPSETSGDCGPIYDSDQDAYILYTKKSTNELVFKVSTTWGFRRPGIPESSLIKGEWLHIVGVYNGSQAMIYLNGVLKDTHTGLIGNVDNGQVAQIGHNNQGDYFKGQIDEIRIYNRALTQDQVGCLYNETPIP
ncbi:MAG: glycerophosphodiester phosphodiesterase family protein [Bacteroidota bacterium]